LAGASRIAARWLIGLLARLAIAAMCTSSVATSDAAHILHATDAMAGRDHFLWDRWREAKSNNQRSPTDCTILGKSQPAPQQAISVQPDLTEETREQ